MTDVSVALWPPRLCPSEGHKHGVSRQSSLNLGDTLLQITREWKTAEAWFLARFFYIPVHVSIIYRISDPWLYSLSGCDFSFDHMAGENREYIGIGNPLSWVYDINESAITRLTCFLFPVFSPVISIAQSCNLLVHKVMFKLKIWSVFFLVGRRRWLHAILDKELDTRDM